MSDMLLTLTTAPMELTLGGDSVAIDIGAGSMPLELGAQIGLGNGGSPLFVSLTVDTLLAAGANGSTYNNTRAVADLKVTLPPAVPPLSFRFRVSASHELGVTPNTGDTIVLDDLMIDDTKRLQSNLIAATLDIECHSDGVWLVTNIRRPWDIA